tara:strand:- start:405 stop:581 length:177 start_codon:yes stop_codon:yes gene_type:complete
MMKNYSVVIDVGSKSFDVEAKSEEEAKQKAIDEFEKLPDIDKVDEYWVGDIEEGEDEK